MGSLMYLIDSNVVIDYLGRKLPSAGIILLNDVMDSAPRISVITKIELLGFRTEKKHLQLLQNFVRDVRILELTNEVTEASIKIRQHTRLKLSDAIIAATALVHELILLTHNLADFKVVKGLQFVDPHQLKI